MLPNQFFKTFQSRVACTPSDILFLRFLLNSIMIYLPTKLFKVEA